MSVNDELQKALDDIENVYLELSVSSDGFHNSHIDAADLSVTLGRAIEVIKGVLVTYSANAERAYQVGREVGLREGRDNLLREQLNAALAAPSIDVERLARAIGTVYPFPGSKPARSDIERLAAEYDRLSRIEDAEPAKEPG